MSKRIKITMLSLVMLGFAASCSAQQQAAWAAMTTREREHVVAHMEGRPVELPDVSGHPFLSCVRAHESGGNYTIVNTQGSTASGAYQFLDSTWRNVAPKAGFPGYSRAMYAPPRVQDHVALWLYNNGGRSAWNGTGC